MILKGQELGVFTPGQLLKNPIGFGQLDKGYSNIEFFLGTQVN